jgi:hypothetical protein
MAETAPAPALRDARERLVPPFRLPARIAWSVCGVSLGLLALLPLLAALVSQPWRSPALWAIGTVGAPLLGALIVSRRPRLRYGWLWLGFGASLTILTFTKNIYMSAIGNYYTFYMIEKFAAHDAIFPA